MTASREREQRPAMEALHPENQPGGLTAILPGAPLHVTDTESADAYFRGCYAVLVRGKSVRRHLYFNLPAAERVVRNATARGDRAEMVLVQLVPVRGDAR